MLETQGPPEGWLGTWSSSKNTLLSGISHDALKAVQDKLCKIVLWSANEGYDPFQFKIFDRIHEEIHNLNIDSKQFVFVSANLNIQIFEKQELLEITDLKKRLEKIHSFIEKETSVISVEKKIEIRKVWNFVILVHIRRQEKI